MLQQPTNNNELAFIKMIEKLLKVKLKPVNEIDPKENSYYTENDHVVKLSISRTKISIINFNKLIELLNNFKHMTMLSLFNNHIIDITPIKKLSQLTNLDLSQNRIKDYTPLRELTRLTLLNLSGNQISNINQLKFLTQLSSLDLGHNRIKDYTPLKALTQLTQLYLDGNQINDLTPLSELTQLTDLGLDNNEIVDLTPLTSLQQLTWLSLEGNLIYDIRPLKELSQLTWLNLEKNILDDITPLKALPQLTELYLYDNQISDITPLKDLTRLNELSLSENQISDITPLKGLTRLTELALHSNQIIDVTPLKHLKQLDKLYLQENQIEDITALVDLKNLSYLDLFANKIKVLPLPLVEMFNEIEVDKIYSFDGLNIARNPLTDPPIEIIKQGRDEILRYFQRIESEDFSSVQEAKLMFVGEGASGKTSLKIRLENPVGSLPKEYERTRGIHITHWEFEKDFTAHMWDFGGQDVYYPVHRFYITENALFILLASTRNEQHNFGYWIPTIYQFGGDSPIIIGQTCHCGNKMPWNDLSIYTGNPLFNIVKNGSAPFYQVNLTDNNEGLDEIKREIIHQIKKLPHCNKKVPTSWVDVRHALLTKSIMCIPYSQFKTICHEVNPNSFVYNNDYSDCCRFLHDIGSVFWYHKNETLREWVILKPELAVDAVYMLIDDKEIKNRYGHILSSDFERLWSDAQYRDHQTVLKEMLVEFRVAFPKRHNRRDYILPTLLESIPEDKIWADAPCITYEYEFTFMMPRAIVNQLSADLSKYILIDDKAGNEEVWNNAVNLIYEGLTKCQVKEDFYNRKIIVKTSGKDARGLMMLVKDSLDAITAAYKGVTYEIIIPCTCRECLSSNKHRTQFKYKDLIRWYNEKGKNSVFCNESGSDISIDEMLNYVGLPLTIDPNKTKGKTPPRKIKIFLASSNELAVERKEFELFIGRENKNLIDKGIFLNLILWEDFIDAMSNTRLQDEYNKTIRDADIFVSLFFTKVGKYTEEEFETAFGNFQTDGKPLVYTYFKNADIKTGKIKEEDITSLFKFKNKVKELGHFLTEYEDINDLKYQFKSQLDKLMDGGK